LRYGQLRSSAQLLLMPVLLLLMGCGNVYISGALNASSTSLASGTVSFVKFTAVFDSKGTLVNVTVVTLVQPPSANTLTFCGNQTSQFAMNSSVQVSFTSGQTCSGLISVVPH
ncbi:MAG TPA: hypothetical protein VG498_22295, partial [Terriglobales bacterium]|nr:hypothetical protein [Terriglobales bacterium]